jgi:hypothetical protein
MAGGLDPAPELSAETRANAQAIRRTRRESTMGPTLGFDTFCDRASQWLRSELEQKLVGVLERAQETGAQWHPNGFAMWNLTQRDVIGRMRLHIWPDENRVVRAWGPKIHRHAWHLASLVICGEYEDVLFEDSDSMPADSQDWREVVPYKVEIAESQRNILPLEQSMFIRVSEARKIPAGRFHFIPADVFHQTTVQDKAFTSTLIVQSPMTSDAGVAIEEGRHPARTHGRESVSVHDAKNMLQQLRGRVA